uniref:Uncharacterized protein n=1 Tax=Sipha flava TaxID=143950 RepID=A0A2S2R2A4_9HEMI
MDTVSIFDALDESLEFSDEDEDDDFHDTEDVVEDNNLLVVENDIKVNESVENSIVTEENAFEINNEECSTSKGKKRTLNPSLWKRNVAKELRVKGQECVILRKKIVKKRVTGPPCKCNLKCFNNVTDKQRLILLNIFNGNKEMQDTFLSGLIEIKEIIRRRPITNEKPIRSVACSYKVRLDGFNEIKVC